MTIDKKRDEQDLRLEIYLRRETFEIQLVLKLLTLLLEQGAHKLVDNCTPENFPIVQGQAKAYLALINMITKPQAPIQTATSVSNG